MPEHASFRIQRKRPTDSGLARYAATVAVACLFVGVAACSGGSLLEPDGGALGGGRGEPGLDGGPSRGDATPRGQLPPGEARRRAPDVCDNGLDEDVDGLVDEGCGCEPGTTQPCYAGPVREAGNGQCAMGTQTCEPSGEFGAWSECRGQGAPANEDCSDGRDNDCDGATDEGCHCTPGERRSCFPGPAGADGVGQCRSGEQVCMDVLDGHPTWGECQGYTEPQPEFCTDGVDSDCDGVADCDDPDCASDRACCTPGEDRFEVRPSPADVMFVVDASGSMNNGLEGAGSRWNGLVTAISDILPSLDTVHRLGLLIFPQSEVDSCAVPSAPEVGLGDAPRAIRHALEGAGPQGSTPTADALEIAYEHLQARREDRPQFILLATDGGPNCMGSSDWESRGRAVQDQIARFRADDGIDTFVLGLLDEPRGLYQEQLDETLTWLAEAGGRARRDTPNYYRASSTTELAAAMLAISAAVGDCSYDLGSEPSPGAVLVVEFDGTPVSNDPSDGWTFAPGRRDRVRFHGAACDRLRRGEVADVTVRSACN